MSDTELEAALASARELGFLGPGPVERHVRHARTLARMLGEFSGTFLDLGAGGGVPGLVLATGWADAGAVLVDAGQRRCRFLEDAVRGLGLAARVRVRCGRAEALAREVDLRDMHALVVARGFGPPPVVAECGVGFVAPGGRLVVTEPPTAADRWPAEGLAALGLVLEDELRAEEVGVVVLRKAAPTAARWPRRTGIPQKRPIW